ncbi:ATP-binding protein [Streptomyces sp. NPDC020298]|uniref:ATP-binding protein n=1 Tax=Streptomyces sp. NPDC020298 TaxID=3155010 RepID=UPI0033E88F72
MPDTWVYALRLPHDPRAARVARMTVRAVLGGHGMRDVVDVVELLTSELVTNAYLHTAGPASLRLTGLGEGRLRVGVWDSHPYIPAPFGRQPEDRVPAVPVGADSGRGLRLVQELATAWGGWPFGDDLLGRRGAGKLLWFEVGGERCVSGAPVRSGWPLRATS